jgi:ankyrin repeat protein
MSDDILPGDIGAAFMDAAEIDWQEGVDVLLSTGVPLAFLLQHAIYYLNCPAVEQLLDAGADIEAWDDYGLTPLRQAIYEEVDQVRGTGQYPSGDLTGLLISRGADPFELAASGYPADLARRLRHPVAERLLRQRMAEETPRP